MKTWKETAIELQRELDELREEIEGHRKAQASVYLALGTGESDRDKWPKQIKAMREAVETWPELDRLRRLRAAIIWWPELSHDQWCATRADIDCNCGRGKGNEARRMARELVGLNRDG